MPLLFIRRFFLVYLLFLLVACGTSAPTVEVNPENPPVPSNPHPKEEPVVAASPSPSPEVLAPLKGYGIQFSCPQESLRMLQNEMDTLLRSFQLDGNPVISIQQNAEKNILEYTLVSDSTDALHLIKSDDLQIENDQETFVNQDGRTQTIQFASEKEIFLALLQRGRTTLFPDKHCSVASLKEHIKMRQGISRWGAWAWFTFPEDGSIARNPRYWDSWSVVEGQSPIAAIADAFTGPMHYAIACTKAVQLSVSQGILDYFVNVKKDAEQIRQLEIALGSEPLNTITPTVRRKKVIEEGSLLTRQFDIPWNNWVPGDWGWIRNDDEESSNTFGGEGSNIVYLGAGLFGSYYDNAADRTIDQALLRVYRWRSADKRENIPDSELLKRIRLDPYSENGMLRNVRDIPRNF